MLCNRKLAVDQGCELATELRPWADQEYWDLTQIAPEAYSILVISRQTLNQHASMIRQFAEQQHLIPVLVNPTEGSQTMKYQLMRLGMLDLVRQGRMLLVGCGDLEPELPNLWYDSYLHKPYDYAENLQECERARAIYIELDKPYTFLFLNGRTRAHRKYAIERLRDLGVLDRSLWTNLDISPVPLHMNHYGEICERPGEIRLLPPRYEVPAYRTNQNCQYQYRFVKNELFSNTWGDIYINADAYIDTYFSVVTETVFDYPYSLRSEKIYKPIAVGHPFVAVANRGFYRDLHRAGFRTFGHLIDESFDQIDNNQDRLDRIIAVIQDLCTQDLGAFLIAARETCVYNQQHMRQQAPGIRAGFVGQFEAFLNQHL